MANLNDKFPTPRTPLADDWMYTVKVDGSEDGKSPISDINKLGADASKNLIIDGQFNHWDEGTSHTVSGYGSATMWAFAQVATTSPLMSRGEFPLGTENPKYFLNSQNNGITDTVIGLFTVYQKLPILRKISGKKITINFDAFGASGAGTIGVRVEQFFGTGGGESSPVSTSQEVSISGSGFENRTVTLDIPDISTKNIGANDDPYVALYFDIQVGSSYNIGYSLNPTYTGTLQISNVSLVEGTTAFSGPFPSAEEERARINYYYRKFAITGRWRSINIGDIFNTAQSFSAMITSPAFALSNGPDTAEASINAPIVVVSHDSTQTSIRFELTSSAAGADCYSIFKRVTLDSRL